MDALERFRREKDDFFRSHPDSPLTADQRRSFLGLRYFPASPALDLTLDIEPYDPPSQVEIQTTTGEVRLYERFGRIEFAVDGQTVGLTVYRSEDGYFLPFADALAGTETYGAGRYLEPEPSSDGRLHVDFNLAYNPYCAYNARWSCPITPAENRLPVAVRAGEMTFQHD
jgi:uncharacterized protein (DUF1684 family)